MSARWLFSSGWLFAGLAWCVCAAAGAQEPIEVVSYPVADLIVPVNMDFTKSAQSQKTCEAELIDLVCRTCAPGSWRHGGGAGTISYLPLGMRFVVRQTRQGHDEVERLLTELRRLQDREVCLETRLFTISGERVQTLEKAFERGRVGPVLPPDGPDGVCLSERECALLMTLLQADPATNIQQSPRVTMFSGQKGVINVVDEVRAEDGDVDQDGQPVTSRAVGLRQVLQPVIEQGRQTVRLYTRTSVTDVQRRPAQPRMFATRTLENVYRIPQGQTLIAKLGQTPGGQHQYVTFTPRIIEQREQTVRNGQPSRPVTRGSAFPQVFEVGDLVTPIQTDAAAAAPEKLVELITESIARKTWAVHGGERDIAFFPIGQALVVNQTAEIQHEIGAVLTALRRLQDLRVGVDCRIVALPEGVAQRIAAGQAHPRHLAGLTIPRPDGAEEQDRVGPRSREEAKTRELLPLGGTVSLVVLDQNQTGQLRRLLAEAQDKTSDTKLGGLGFNGQRLRMDATAPRQFVTDLEVRAMDGQVLVKPTVRTERIGTLVEAVPVLTADRKQVRFEVTITQTEPNEVGKPRTVKVTVDGREQEFTLHSAGRNSRQVRSVMLVPASGSAVLSLGQTGSGDARDGGRSFIMITPRVYAE